MTRSDALEFAVKQRAYDGLWELLGKFPDPDNFYHYYHHETKQKVTLPAYRWITIDVTDTRPDLRKVIKETK